MVLFFNIGGGLIIGESHDILRKEDFALGFMNATMGEKLRDYSTIICMDGTHGTNRRGMDLTIVLVKDDRNAGFPVVFFLSNRLDQVIQEVFLGALRNRIGQEIEPAYFMSDDDPKYYNAWVKMMSNKPKRLLCTWHVVKNWNIQGKNKIKDLGIRKEMKGEMKRILNETSEERFAELSGSYFKKLQEANEEDFVNYLSKYVFLIIINNNIIAVTRFVLGIIFRVRRGFTCGLIATEKMLESILTWLLRV